MVEFNPRRIAVFVMLEGLPIFGTQNHFGSRCRRMLMDTSAEFGSKASAHVSNDFMTRWRVHSDGEDRNVSKAET